MIDLRISNHKLYRRSVRIIDGLTGAGEPAAEEALLRSIHRVDRITRDIREMPVSSHVRVAVGRERVVPVALLLAARKWTYERARAEIQKEPILRNIVRDLHR